MKRNLLALISLLLACSAPGQGTWDTRSDTWLATDALGRTLPNAEVAGAPRVNRTVALFYYLWNGSHTTGLYDIAKIIAQDPSAIHDFDNPLWGPLYNWHFWGEPLFGYYFMQDEWILRRHAQMLTDAGVDVIILDSTNGPNNQYKPVYDKLFNVYQDLLAHGQDVPKIAFMTHTDSGASVQKLYDDIYASGRHSNLWYYWDGKPLILGTAADMTQQLRNFFTVRYSWAWEPGEDSWGWLEDYPQQGGWSGTPSNLEQVPVASGGHPHHPNGGNGKSNHLNIQPANTDLDTELGIKFADQWRRARELDPPVVLVTQWNEWTAQRFQYTGGGQSYAGRPLYTGDPWFIDVYNQEFNRDLEPMKGGHGDNFYYQLADNIRRYKGVRSGEPASPPTTITLSDFSGWDAVAPEFRDDQDDVRHRDHRGFGTEYYTNTSGRNDIRRCKVARDSSNLYLFVETVDPITAQASGGEYWMNCFLRDETLDAPNWEGYHYRLSNENPSSGKLTLLQSTGGWNWVSLGEVETEVSGNRLAVSVPRDSGLAHYSFKWTDNQLGTTADAWLLNGDAAPNARFRYRYWAGGAGEVPVHGKTYRLINGDSLEVAAPVGDATVAGQGLQTGANGFGLNQKWTAYQLDTGPWVLFNAKAAVENGPANPLAIGVNGGVVQNETYAGAASQHWHLLPLGGGWFRIVNAATGQALSRDPTGALVPTAAPPAPDQYWGFEPVAPLDSGGKYRLSNRRSQLKADVENSSMNPGTEIVQKAATGGWNQDWLAYVQGAERIQLVGRESRRPLESTGTATGVPLTQGSWTADGLQQWEMDMARPGFFQLLNDGSGQVIGLQGGSAASGTRLVQQPAGSGTDQQWYLSAAAPPAGSFDHLFLDTFDTPDTTDENADYAVRQADGAAVSPYTAAPVSTYFSIKGNKLWESGGGTLTLDANLAGQVVGKDFELSFRLAVFEPGTEWASVYLISATENARQYSRLGLYAPGSGWAYVLYKGTGSVQELDPVSEAEMTSLLGAPFDHAQEHLLRFVSTAGTGGTNSYNFLVDGVVVRSDLPYAFSDSSVCKVEFIANIPNGSSNGAYFDDLALRYTPPPYFAKWAEDNGLAGSDAARSADPDADTMDNLVEYALGGIPTLGDADSVLPTAGISADTFEYVYSRRRDAADRGLSYSLSASTNLLAPWFPADPAWETGTAAVDPYFESVTNQIPLSGLEQGFLELQIGEE